MNTEKKLEFIIDILPLIPLVARGVSEAVDTYKKMTDVLKEGNASDEELAEMITERDDVLDRIIAKTSDFD